MLYENLKIALRAINASKMRSLLTVLGVMIGVAAVIAVVSLVQGLQYQISQQLQSVGSTFIRVVPDFGSKMNPFLQHTPELTYDDALAVQRTATTIRAFTPLFISNGATKHGDARHETTLLAVNQSYQEVANSWVDRGRFFTSVDEEARKRVCVVGTEVARSLALPNPIGQVIDINSNSFTIVGVMEKKGSSMTGDSDDIVFIPFETAVIIFGREQMKHLALALQVRSQDDIDLAREQVRATLRARHKLKKGEPDDFRISAQEELLKTISGVLLNVSLIMAAVVGIALLVGGIGIMNIMLVSVTERTREIGIRKSIGARRHDVLLQFLIEAIALSGLGGLIGIASGYLLANGVRLGLRKFVELPPIHTPLWAILISFGFCAVLGVIFGIYPAAKASKLDPIEALRYE